jgi:hypothetical protein
MRWPRRFGERGWLVRPQDSNSARAFVPEFGSRGDDDAGDVICEFDLRAVLPTVLRALPQDDSLITAEISLIGDLNSLQYRKKCPVPTRRELTHKALISCSFCYH